MTQYNVGSDHSGNGDEACINNICDILEQNGHTTERLGVNPNLEGSLTSRNGVGVFIVNGLCIGTVRSCSENQKNCDKIIFAIPKVIYGGSIKIPDELKTKPLKLDPRQGWPDSYKDINGKTWDEVCGMYDNIEYVWGETCEDCANNIMNGTQGGSSSDGTSSEGEESVMSGWESITDLLKPLDGEAMVVVRGDTVIVKRIYPPNATRLWIYEGVNIVADSVKVSDYSPEIYNTFVINWGASFENSFEMCFEKHKELFGERKTEVNAIYEVAPTSATESSEDSEESEGTDEQSEDDGGLFGFLGGFLDGGEEEDKNKTTEQSPQQTGTDDETEDQPLTEIPITDEAEAYLFGLKQVGKARRKDGHKIECKVIGSKYFEVGEWCRVYIPSFNEDTIMFISKVSHDSSTTNEWITSLTLVDYPPSLGSGQSNTAGGSEEDTGNQSQQNTDSQNGEQSENGENNENNEQQTNDANSNTGGNN